MQIPRENKAINEWGPSWDSMIGDSAQIENWKNWGYFALPLTKSDGTPIGTTPSKVISLNSNICYQFNWESMMQFADPGNMLEWLENEL